MSATLRGKSKGMTKIPGGIGSEGWVESPVTGKYIKTGGKTYNSLYSEHEDYFKSEKTKKGNLEGKHGCSNSKKYEGQSGPFCGPESCPRTFPVRNPGEFRAAESYARFADKDQQESIRACAKSVRDAGFKETALSKQRLNAASNTGNTGYEERRKALSKQNRGRSGFNAASTTGNVGHEERKKALDEDESETTNNRSVSRSRSRSRSKSKSQSRSRSRSKSQSRSRSRSRSASRSASKSRSRSRSRTASRSKSQSRSRSRSQSKTSSSPRSVKKATPIRTSNSTTAKKTISPKRKTNTKKSARSRARKELEDMK